MNINLKIEGLDRLQRKWSQAPTSLKKKAADALEKAGRYVEANSKAETPVDTGRLRSSIKTRVEKGINPRAVISPHTTYAIYQEVGVRPHHVSGKYIERWAKRHGVPVGAVQKAIATRGIKGKHYMEKGYNRSRTMIRLTLLQLLKEINLTLK